MPLYWNSLLHARCANKIPNNKNIPDQFSEEKRAWRNGYSQKNPEIKIMTRICQLKENHLIPYIEIIHIDKNPSSADIDLRTRVVENGSDPGTLLWTKYTIAGWIVGRIFSKNSQGKVRSIPPLILYCANSKIW